MERSLVPSSSGLPPPSREEVRAKLAALLSGDVTRDEATEWAWQWVAADEPGVSDKPTWTALNQLAGADAISLDRPFLFLEADFQSWLDELDSSGELGAGETPG